MPHNDTVVLSVPARGEYARTVRLAAAELAARIEMSIDEVDDVRLAVDEAFVAVCERPGIDSVTFTFTLEPSRLRLLVGPIPTADAGAQEPGLGAAYSRFILESICDEYEAFEGDDGSYIRLMKQAGA